MAIPRRARRRITRLADEFATVTVAVARHIADPAYGDERHGEVIIRMQEAQIRASQRAKDELVALDRRH